MDTRILLLLKATRFIIINPTLKIAILSSPLYVSEEAALLDERYRRREKEIT